MNDQSTTLTVPNQLLSTLPRLLDAACRGMGIEAAGPATAWLQLIQQATQGNGQVPQGPQAPISQVEGNA